MCWMDTTYPSALSFPLKAVFYNTPTILLIDYSVFQTKKCLDIFPHKCLNFLPENLWHGYVESILQNARTYF